MPVDITFLGHSGFVLSTGDQSIAVDPFLTGNPLAKHKPADIACQYIALTHGHADHLGDTLTIAQANDATVIAPFEISEYLGEKGLTKLESANPGGKIITDFGYVALTHAFHSSSFKGRYMGMPCGLVIRIGGVTLYHCGDTGLFGDMKLISDIYEPDVAMIPIGDRFTMGPKLAARAAEMIRPRMAIPIHYNTWPPIAQDPRAFAPTGVEVKILQPGEAFTFSREPAMSKG